jgi:hypothetical protein
MPYYATLGFADMQQRQLLLELGAAKCKAHIKIKSTYNFKTERGTLNHNIDD